MTIEDLQKVYDKFHDPNNKNHVFMWNFNIPLGQCVKVTNEDEVKFYYHPDDFIMAIQYAFGSDRALHAARIILHRKIEKKWDDEKMERVMNFLNQVNHDKEVLFSLMGCNETR